jgi:hypothetical protein
VQQGAGMEGGIGVTPLQLSVRLGHQQMQQVLRELARIKRIMRDAAAREHRAGEIAGGGAVEEECEPSTSQRSSYPSAPPSVEAAVQAPSAASTLCKCLRRLRRLQLARRLRCPLECRHAGLLHCPLGVRNECLARSPRLASTFAGIATTAAALVDTAFAAARSAAISAGFWLALAAFVSFIATFPIASTGRVAEAQPQPGGGCKKEKERQRKERQRQRKIGAGERGAAGSDGGEVCERPL